MQDVKTSEIPWILWSAAEMQIVTTLLSHCYRTLVTGIGTRSLWSEKCKFMFTEFIKFSTKTEDVLMFREEEGAGLKLIHKFVLVGGWFFK